MDPVHRCGRNCALPGLVDVEALCSLKQGTRTPDACVTLRRNAAVRFSRALLLLPARAADHLRPRFAVRALRTVEERSTVCEVSAVARRRLPRVDAAGAANRSPSR